MPAPERKVTGWTPEHDSPLKTSRPERRLVSPIFSPELAGMIVSSQPVISLPAKLAQVRRSLGRSSVGQ